MSNQTKLFNVFNSLFGVSASDFSDASSQDTIEQWDSLGMVNLVAELEKEFDVQFDLLEIADFRNVAIIKSTLHDKGVSFD